MPHPDIDNQTGFEFFPLFVNDENGLPIVSTIVKATYRIDGQSLVLNDKQHEIRSAVEYWGPPESSSVKFESETAFTKPATDVILIGHAHAPKVNTTHVSTGIKVGPVQKIVHVFGDRYWVKQRGHIMATKPQPFERIPLRYERAFGGWDKSDKDSKHWRFERRNPVGTGFGDPLRYADEGKVAMPNLEDPQNPIRNYGDHPHPAAFGYIAPHWEPRCRYAGTYDAAWENDRQPLLPVDFDRRFFNSATLGLTSASYLKGNEDVILVGVTSVPKLALRLPNTPPPVCTIRMKRGKAELVETNLDTVLIDVDEMLVFLMWRGYTKSNVEPNDVTNMVLASDQSTHRAAAG